MATYTIKINERTKKGRMVLAFLKSLNYIENTQMEKERFLKDLKDAGNEALKIAQGEIKWKSLDELLKELG